MQTQGLGTALKILFSEKEIKNLPEHSPSKGFQLTRQEIVALMNGFGRYGSAPCECGLLPTGHCALCPVQQSNMLVLFVSDLRRLSTSIYQLHHFRQLLKEKR